MGNISVCHKATKSYTIKVNKCPFKPARSWKVGQKTRSLKLAVLDWVATRVNKAIYDFLWNGKTELVKRTTCQLPFHHGGLAVINPSEKARALKLPWVPQIGDPSCKSNWVFFARYWVGLALSRKVPSWSFLRSNACPCRQYCFGLLSLISAELISRMGVKLKSHPKCPTHVVHLSHARVLKLAS